MEERPDPALGGLFIAITLGLVLVPVVAYVVIVGPVVALVRIVAIALVVGVLGAAAAGAVWMNRRISRRVALVLWPCVAAATLLFPRALFGPPDGGAWLLLLIPFFSALAGFFQALWPDA